MRPFERKIEILKILHYRKKETIRNLANEFGVSMRTIRRDIEEISLRFPVYTVQGKYNGGIYLMDEAPIDYSILQ